MSAKMAGDKSEDSRSLEEISKGVGTMLTPSFDIDDDDDDYGPKPSELYKTYTWIVTKFSKINSREGRSNVFEAGGCKWYIQLIFSNYLSLYLCVADYDKLPPGWSQFAQFTITVTNKDPKKSKYSDSLHSFWKKEYQWEWKNVMESSKMVNDGFVDNDILIVKAQIQVIRARADRPFRCLDRHYRRQLVKVYLSDLEQVCRRFEEEERGRIGKLIKDKVRWSSFCSFWSGLDQKSRRELSREKSDLVLAPVVMQFFIEKDVTTILLMDSLHSGLKALEDQTKCDAEEVPITPLVHMENDTFVLVDDVLLLLERFAIEPLPPKDEKGPQNRTKDGGLDEDYIKDSVERNERRFTELGRRTIEIFILAHIFSNIECLKMQEELIREEEEAGMAKSEQKAKRASKKKKSKR